MDIRNLSQEVYASAWANPKSKAGAGRLRQDKNLQELDRAVERLIWLQIADLCWTESDKHFRRHEHPQQHSTPGAHTARWVARVALAERALR